MRIKTTIKLGREQIRNLLDHLDNSHLKIPIVHVAGRNGKGSVGAFKAEILRTAGYRVDRFTSPFLIEPSDSIHLDGNRVDRETFEDSQCYVWHLIEKHKLEISLFKLLTAVAFKLFSRPESKLDLAVVEVGLGGGMDATNVCESKNTLLSFRVTRARVKLPPRRCPQSGGASA